MVTVVTAMVVALFPISVISREAIVETNTPAVRATAPASASVEELEALESAQPKALLASAAREDSVSDMVDTEDAPNVAAIAPPVVTVVTVAATVVTVATRAMVATVAMAVALKDSVMSMILEIPVISETLVAFVTFAVLLDFVIPEI